MPRIFENGAPATDAESSTPRLLDRGAVVGEYGFGRSDVDRIFRHLNVVQLPGARKSYVRRDELEAYLEDCTFDGRTRVPPAA